MKAIPAAHPAIVIRIRIGLSPFPRLKAQSLAQFLSAESIAEGHWFVHHPVGGEYFLLSRKGPSASMILEKHNSAKGTAAYIHGR